MSETGANALLVCSADARLLILNADDLGKHRAVNEATPRALTEGVVRSATRMVPCPGGAIAVQLFGERPAIAVGVHLTADRNLPEAYARIPTLLKKARLNELEVEFRARIDAVRSDVDFLVSHAAQEAPEEGEIMVLDDRSAGGGLERALTASSIAIRWPRLDVSGSPRRRGADGLRRCKEDPTSSRPWALIETTTAAG